MYITILADFTSGASLANLLMILLGDEFLKSNQKTG